ncbi:ubiquitin-conjugating enzyme E2-binding protein [Blakeslea trispora]|nr:ubiquitin-conjugating enzyme E2-binding protein [Blakeslea trispora]
MIPFFAEELSNINVLRACISVDAGCDVARLLEVKDSQLKLNDTVVADLSQVNTSVSTQNLVVNQPTTSSTDSLIPWEIKLSLIDTQKRSQQTELKEWWPAKDLAETDHLVCQHCLQPLIETYQYQFKDLPSEHWYELVECWICHETKPEEHKSRMRPILAKPNVILVGTTYVLIHAQNILQAAVQPDKTLLAKQDWSKGTFTKWVTLHCSTCDHVIGEGQYNETSELLAAKIFKYTVAPSPSPVDQPVFTDFLMSDLVSAAKTHATHKFLIQGKSEQVYCLLWLFNWDTHILFNGGYSQTDQDIQRKRVAKVMYLDCTNKADQHVQKHLSLWSKDKSIDHMIYPDQFCQQLMHTLTQSSLVLPPFMRQIDHPAMLFTLHFSVGFLPRT